VVVISNPAAGELLNRQLPAGATLDEVFPEEVVSMWHDSRESGRDEEAVFEHGRRTLEAVTYPVGSGADFDSIIVLRDVSAQAKLERARRDFIANASHEFKTPLFSLSGFIELLEEAELSGDERDEFLQLMRQPASCT
jgi:signal transduction histidine kinase